MDLLKWIFVVALCINVRGDVASFFNESSEGWTSVGDTVAGVEYLPAGGVTSGTLRVRDEATGGVWYWVAPAKFLGNQSSALGRSLQFSLRQVISGSANQFTGDDVILEGGNLRLVYQMSSLPPVNGTWQQYEIGLTADSGWKLGTATGPAATEEQVATVLANLTMLRIRGEYQAGVDTGYIDNVLLGQSASVAPLLGLKVLPVVYVSGSLGSTYVIEYSEFLTPDSWTLLEVVTLDKSPIEIIDVTAEGRPKRNYRARLAP